ncbi:MAG TPA: methyl-accepting chemotaxis protein [Gemmatimonadaceae bacterium]|nr:methyl-accepting chemotaxis protein [Gemmatimonadaceae bacterium]
MRTIRGRLLAGFGLMMVMLIAAIWLGMTALDSVHDDLRARMREESVFSGRLNESGDAALRSVTLAQAALLTGRENRAQLDSLAWAADSLRRSLLRGAALTMNERSRLERVGNLQAQMEVRLANARAYRDIGRIDQAALQASYATAALDTLYANIAELAASQQRRTSVALNRVELSIERYRVVLVLLLMFGMAGAFWYGRVTWRAVTSPLGSLTAAARRYGAADFSTDLDGSGFDDEYRVLTDAFREMAHELRVLVSSIQRESSDLANISGVLSAAAEEAAASTGEISGAASDVARDAQSQRDTITTSSKIVDEVGTSANTLDRTADRSRALEEEIRATASRARRGISDALRALGEAKRVIGTSGGRVQQIQEASSSLGALVDIIHEIARETKMLALNASIEAARAGEHGRGFAVVAREVGELAEHCAQAAGEATQMVGTMHQHIAEAASAFNAGVGELGDVSAVSNDAATALGVIDAALAGFGEVTSDIQQAAMGNRNAVAALSRHLETAEGQADSQAAASEEAAAAAEQTAATAEEVASTAQHLAASADRLRGLVVKFRL